MTGRDLIGPAHDREVSLGLLVQHLFDDLHGAHGSAKMVFHAHGHIEDEAWLCRPVWLEQHRDLFRRQHDFRKLLLCHRLRPFAIWRFMPHPIQIEFPIWLKLIKEIGLNLKVQLDVVFKMVDHSEGIIAWDPDYFQLKGHLKFQQEVVWSRFQQDERRFTGMFRWWWWPRGEFFFFNIPAWCSVPCERGCLHGCESQRQDLQLERNTSVFLPAGDQLTCRQSYDHPTLTT